MRMQTVHPINRPASTALLVAAALGLAFMLIVFARDYGLAPAIVATHFGVTGAPNAWGPKGTFIIFPIVGVVVFGIVAVFALLGVPASSGKTVPPVVSFLTGLSLVEVIWVLALAEYHTFEVALGRESGLGAGFFVGIGLILVTTLAVVVVTVSEAVRGRLG